MIWIARLVWLYAALAAAACALLGILFPGIFDAFAGNEVEGVIFFSIIGFVGATYATAGILILRQRLRHAVGWILLVAGACFPTEFLAFAIGFRGAQQDDPVGIWLVLLSGALFWPMLLLVGPVVALFFPDGRLPSAGWRWPARIGAGIVGLVVVALLVRPGSLDPENGLPANPLGVDAIPLIVFEMLEAAGFMMAALTVAVAISSIVIRYRRATDVERLQLRWFVFAVAVWCVLLPISLLSESIIPAAITSSALVLLPMSILIAVTRYRLYEIDTLINRTLVYVPLVGIVAGLYAGSVAMLQRLSVAVTGDTSDGAAILSALVLATLFTPIRKWIEGIVDRRFKPAVPDGSAAAPLARTFSADDPDFLAAVESAVRRVLTERQATDHPPRTVPPAVGQVEPAAPDQ